jgi:uncharacterized protein
MRPREFQAHRLDIRAFAEAAGQLQGQIGATDLARWSDLRHSDADDASDPLVTWSARAELRPRRAAPPEVWLHLQAAGTLPMTCQRCLAAVHVPMTVDRWFRFVDTEQEAAQLDEESDDDVLVLHQAFDLIALIEDELLLDAPIVPRHEHCPDAPTLSTDPDLAEGNPDAFAPDNGTAAAEAATDESPSPARKHPFAALAGLRDQLKKG